MYNTCNNLTDFVIQRCHDGNGRLRFIIIKHGVIYSGSNNGIIKSNKYWAITDHITNQTDIQRCHNGNGTFYYNKTWSDL